MATYKPVECKPGYVWVTENSIVKLEILRELYEEFKEKGKEV